MSQQWPWSQWKHPYRLDCSAETSVDWSDLLSCVFVIAKSVSWFQSLYMIPRSWATESPIYFQTHESLDMKSGSYLWCHWVHKHYKNLIEKLFHISWPSRTYVRRRSPNNLHLNPNICAGRDLGLCILLLSWKIHSLSEKPLYSLFYLQRERKWREWSGVNNIFMMVNWVVISSRSNYWLLVLVICLLCRHWQEPGQYCRNQIHAVSCIPPIRVRGLISTQSRLGTNWSYENMRSNLRIVNIVGICRFRQFFKFRCCSGIKYQETL